VVRRDPTVRAETQTPGLRPAAPPAATAAGVTVRLPATANAPVRVAAPAAQPQQPVARPVAPPQAVAAAPVAPRPATTNGAATNAAAAANALLTVGVGVTLKGSMQCDLLRVEGNVEGDVRARKLVLVTGGTLVGTVEVHDAEIEGHFEGILVATGTMVVRSAGRLSGKFQYGEIEIERGGVLAGEIMAHNGAAPVIQGLPDRPVPPRPRA
jgi:cytoskeletal protein CcmA (bactofilin family)